MHDACKMTTAANAAPIGRYWYVQTALTNYSNLLHEDAFAGAYIDDANQVRVGMSFDALVHFLIDFPPVGLLRPPFNDPIPSCSLVAQVCW